MANSQPFHLCSAYREMACIATNECRPVFAYVNVMTCKQSFIFTILKAFPEQDRWICNFAVLCTFRQLGELGRAHLCLRGGINNPCGLVLGHFARFVHSEARVSSSQFREGLQVFTAIQEHVFVL